ncbi:MAG: efflux RND transporter periplasmic adaptor subunit [Anaerolineales bacterium]|jgi:multidrug resistance efflux pump
MRINKLLWLVGVLLIGLLVTGCDAVTSATTQTSNVIEASGVVEAVEIVVASEINGRVVEINAEQGDAVKAGDVLLVLENETLNAQHRQAVAALEAAETSLAAAGSNKASADAGVQAAHLGLEIANQQYDSVLQAVRLREVPARAESWNGDPPNQFELPSWYYSQDEAIEVAHKEVTNALDDLNIEKANLEDVLNDVSNADIRQIEERLASAQFSFQLADELIDRQVEQNGRESISDYLQSLYDSAEAELESAQAEYDSVLSDQGAEDLLEARARVKVADERYQLALAKLYQLQTGERSIEVIIADLGVKQAEAFVNQAEAALGQAEAAVNQADKMVEQASANLNIIELQIEKLTVSSQVDGVVMAKAIEVGELLQPGVTALTIGKLDQLTITVYVPEEIYGRIMLGDQADVRVDSFPDKVFSAVVTRIADQAEYTPRNVQTTEDRKTTVFAIELSVLDANGQLKPGMPADVSFQD